jgi:arginine:pyruvate transaminase
LEPSTVHAAITPRTRALLLNFPHNPTGASLTAAEAAAAAELARRHDLWLISDEVYAALADDGVHTSPLTLPGMRDRGVLISSLSKSHAMTGWRVGWAVTPPALATHLRTLARAMFFGLPPFIQDAAAHALSHGGAELARLREAYRRRAAVVADGLAAVPGIVARAPDAGMYVFADVRGTGRDGKQFARGLLDEHGVSVTPGEGFGPSGAGHVRMTLGTAEDRLAEACARIGRYVRTLA